MATMSRGWMYWALLIRATDLEETLENLILNQLDLTTYRPHLLESNAGI